MRETTVALDTPAGPMETFIVHPEGAGPFPAVVLYMDIWGVREELFDLARRIAVVGYCCLVPDLYHRQGRVRTSFRNAEGRMISVALLTEEQKEVVRAPLRKLTDAMVLEDTEALFRYLDARPEARRGPMACIGYCMGGRFVFRAAGRYPERFRVAASLHGSDLVTDKPDSPHLDVARAQGELYCGFAEKDRYALPEIVAAIDATLNNVPGLRYHAALHRGADHGYALPDRDVHDREGFNRDWEIFFAMLHRQMPQYVPPA